jgi:sterol desaturase/sphingolipid hydroxylase (fatty acid hydroxylase superfamily)
VSLMAGMIGRRRVAIPASVLAAGLATAGVASWLVAAHDIETAVKTILGTHSVSVAWLLSKIAENISHNMLEILAAPVTFGDRLHWANVAGFLVFSLIAVLLYGRARGRPGLRGLLRTVCPPEHYKHPSAVVDYQLFLLNRILTPARPLTRALSATAMAALVVSALSAAFGPSAGAHLPEFGGVLVYTLLVVIVGDFAGWANHVLMHRVPVLWEFHKVHHSAEVLTPLTYYRIHPVEEVMSVMVSVLVSGSFSGILAYLLLEQPTLLAIFGVNIVIAPYLLMANLRHSHVWLSWGPWASRLFISPAQHQIHHSQAPRHCGKNYGSIFAIWDWMFGTLYVPREKEELQFGLPGPQPHNSAAAAYLNPFKTALRVVLHASRAPRHARARSAPAIAASVPADARPEQRTSRQACAASRKSIPAGN